jgi:uncharacterized caspase-like protein
MTLYGVFVGIDQYQDPMIHSLEYAKADAQRFYQLFRERFDPADQALWLLMDEQATKLQTMKTIGEDVSRLAKEDDIVVLHFSGHGSPETSGSIDKVSRYLVAHDTEYESIFATGIDMERELRTLFHRIRSKLVLFFLDSCFSGLVGGRTFEGPGIRRAHDYRGTIRLRESSFGEGRLMMAACDDDQIAQEDPELGHGIFTHYLLEVLTDPKYPGNTMTVGQTYERVFRRVEAHTMGRQTPILNGRAKLAQIPKLA